MRTLLILLTTAGCANPPPECAPRGNTYEICADDKVWTCPTGPESAVAFNLSVDEACNREEDPVQCILDAEYEMVEMELAVDCAGADLVCVEDVRADPMAATCEEP